MEADVDIAAAATPIKVVGHKVLAPGTLRPAVYLPPPNLVTASVVRPSALETACIPLSLSMTRRLRLAGNLLFRSLRSPASFVELLTVLNEPRAEVSREVIRFLVLLVELVGPEFADGPGWLLCHPNDKVPVRALNLISRAWMEVFLGFSRLGFHIVERIPVVRLANATRRFASTEITEGSATDASSKSSSQSSIVASEEAWTNTM